MRFNLRLIGLYGFILFIAWLSGTYFGSWLLVLFWLLLAYPVLSIVLTGLGFRRLRVEQETGGGSTMRGEVVHFRFRLVNGSALPIPRVSARIRSHTPLADSSTGRVFSLGPRETLEWEESFRFTYRGVYRLGLEALEVSDLLRFVTLALPTDAKTFRIYPRVFSVKGSAPQAVSPDGARSASTSRGSPDPTLFSRVREYLSGEPIRHIYWKKFASVGIPFLKEYEGARLPIFTIYPDLRPADTPGADHQEQEDSTVEILVTLVRYLLDRGAEARIDAPGLQATLSGRARFPELYERCVELPFRSTLSPAAVHQAGKAESWVGIGSSILLVHRLDTPLIEHVEAATRSGEPVTLILNQAGHPPVMQAGNERIFRQIRSWGLPMFLADGARSLARDLEGTPHA